MFYWSTVTLASLHPVCTAFEKQWSWILCPKPYGSQNREYLLSGPLQKVCWALVWRMEGDILSMWDAKSENDCVEKKQKMSYERSGKAQEPRGSQRRARGAVLRSRECQHCQGVTKSRQKRNWTEDMGFAVSYHLFVWILWKASSRRRAGGEEQRQSLRNWVDAVRFSREIPV